ncbi:MAG: mechanosensitive ion channel [Bacteroidota bacterium]
MDKVDQYISDFTDWAVVFIPKLLIAIIILFVGLWLVKRVSKLIDAALMKAKISPEIATFLGSILEIGLKFVVILIAAAMIGFEVSSLVAVLAAAGFAVGLALQGFLGNFASGITIVFFKPYKVGDWVEISDKFGKVQSIQIFNTTLITPGEKTLIIPNGQVTDGIITNFSTRGHIRLELQVTMPYEESFTRVKEVILESMKEAPNVLQDPAPQVGIEQYDSHNIIIAVRPFIDPDDYWDATFDILERIKRAFNSNKVKVAYSEGVELGPIGD